MEELVKLVTQKAGISSEQATRAINAVVAFVKEKLPGPIGAEVEKLIAGGAGGGMGELGSLLGKAEGMFGGLGHKS